MSQFKTALDRSELKSVQSDDVERDPSIRRFPYPYSAMLAICSDLDETPDGSVYWESSRFLNTTERTGMGHGVGLEVGNTIYFDMPPQQFAYWNTDDAGRHRVRALIQSGHVDCLHSFGDLATSRAHAGRALDELARHDCRLEVWIDHATAPTNFGSDIMRGSGDVMGANAYHADLSCAFGIKYIWRGRVTSMIGQDVAPSVGGILDSRYPLSSAITVAKEFAKGRLGAHGNLKYRPHATNRVTFAAVLRDGRHLTEFLRSNPHYQGPSGGDTASGIHEVLSRRLIDRLVARKGFCILYTHLGKIRERERPFSERACAAFRMLAERAAAGDVLVTTTRRLLNYADTIRRTRVQMEEHEGLITVRLRFWPSIQPACEPDLDGLTVYSPRTDRIRVVVEDHEVTSPLKWNPADESGQTSFSLPWRRLQFPDSL